MLEVLKLAFQVIAEVLDLVYKTESGVITPDQAKQSLEGFKKKLQENDDAADSAVDAKFPEDQE